MPNVFVIVITTTSALGCLNHGLYRLKDYTENQIKLSEQDLGGLQDGQDKNTILYIFKIK